MTQTANTPPAKERPLTAKMLRFVELYLVSLNATKAYREAYKCTEAVANRSGPRLLVNVGVQRAIAQAMAKRSERTEITQDMVLQRFWDIATANPGELVEFRRTCCRHCWGEDFNYQLTQRELDQREADARKVWENRKVKKPTDTFMFFDFLGGAGWDPRKNPNTKCPECFGEGVGSMYIHDSRKTSPQARLLYAGMKQTKDGLEVRMRDFDGALVKVGEHLGMFKGANLNLNVDYDKLTDTQLEHLANGGSIATLPV